jgi:hypothetical protein
MSTRGDLVIFQYVIIDYFASDLLWVFPISFAVSQVLRRIVNWILLQRILIFEPV